MKANSFVGRALVMKSFVLFGVYLLSGAALACGGSPDGSSESTDDTAQASSSGCTGIGNDEPYQCIGLNGTGQYVNYVNSQFYYLSIIKNGRSLCGQHHVWDSKKKLNEYSARQCIKDDPASGAAALAAWGL